MKFKTASYYLVAFALPFLILALLEGVLRSVNFAPSYPLFISANNLPGYLQPNPDVIKRFFAAPDLAPDVSPDTQYFLSEKPRNSYRIVVQGGSTAAGFPYGRWGSLSGMLHQRFKRLYPNKHIEVINTAMASVNSYTLLDFVDEIKAIQPDLVLIYAGHNEYLGVMGVGSSFAGKGSRAANLLYLTFKDWQLYRLIESLYVAIMLPDKPNTLNERTLMANIAKEKDIPFGSELYQAGVAQFEGNMRLILASYQQAKVPVILGTLASNEKDQPPFDSISTDVDWNSELAHVENLSTAEEKKLTKRAANTPEQLAAADWYRLGHLFHLQQEYEQAGLYFTKAKDSDALRFRAPEVFNQVIRHLADEFEIAVADVQLLLRSDSSDKLIGNKHMLEHLHPTKRGYFLLAQAYLQQILESGFLPKPINNNLINAWQEQPVSKADAAYGEFKIERLTSDYPFTNTPIEVETPKDLSIESQALRKRVHGQGWLALNQTLLTEYQKQGDFAQAALVAGLLADAIPAQFQSHYAAGMLYKRINNLPLSTYHLHQAVLTDGSHINAHLSLAQNYMNLQLFTQSLQHLQRVKLLQPDHNQIDNFIKMVKQASR